MTTTNSTRVGSALFDEGAELHDPALYSPTAEAHQVATLAEIGPAEIAFYRENGYLAVTQAFS